MHVQEDFPNLSTQVEKSIQTPTRLRYFSISMPILLRQRPDKYIAEGSKYAQLIGLYLNLHLSWVLGPFAQGRLQKMKTNEDTIGHLLTP